MLRTLGSVAVLALSLLPSLAAAGTPSPFIEEEVLQVPRPWVNNVVNETSHVSMALDAAGVPHLLFHVPNRAIYHAMRTGNGWAVECVDSAVAVPSPDTSIGFGTHARIAFDAQGRAHIAYVHNRFRNGFSTAWKQIFYRHQLAPGFGQPWSVRESTNPGEGFVNLGNDLSLGVSSDGSSAYIVTNRAGAQPSVVYQERVGGTWTTPFAPLFPYPGTLQDLVVTPSGVPWICSNTGSSTGDVVVAQKAGDAWQTQLAGDSNINTNPNGRLAVHGASGDNLYMCFEARPDRVGLRTRVNGEWRDLLRGVDPEPVIPTLGRLRLASAPAGWAPWILSSTGTGGVINGELLAASSTLTPGEWSTLDVSSIVALSGNEWIAVGAPNRVHVVYQVLDDGAEGGMRLRYAVYDAPGPPALGVDLPNRDPRVSLRVAPNVVNSNAELRLFLSAQREAPATLSIHDVAGRVLRSREVAPVSASGTSVTWGMNGLEPGIYFLSMRCGPSRVTQRFVVLP